MKPSFWAEIVKRINNFLYTKPKIKKPVVSKEDIIKQRKEISNVLFDVLSGKQSVLDAVLHFPKSSPDSSVNVCFHILVPLCR